MGKPRRKQHRYSFDPLERYLFVTNPHAEDKYSNSKADYLLTDKQIATCCHVHRSIVNRWRNQGLTMGTIDRVCGVLSIHPTYVWGNEYWEDIELEEEDEDHCLSEP